MFAVSRKRRMDKLLLQITEKQSIMIELGLKTGFNSCETITVSQELDVLIVAYQRLKEEQQSSKTCKTFWCYIKELFHKSIFLKK
ncbi:Spo0E family sporulation regulatory protein-aspartic acid phosphatase [Ectobacillus polymachus]|uniref:Spo0E family sporulation regulatory protein-aspartic acid phosphatase n=1 Tax=Ectobacillus polymachus TaxID=1508806 RepID=UPI003A888C3A